MRFINFGTVALSLLMISATVVDAPAKTVDSTTSSGSTLTSDQEAKFYEDLQSGIKKSLDQYKTLKSKVDATKDSNTEQSDKDRQALMNAATALEVKYTLYKNFYNTPSVNSAAIRNNMVKIFNKDFITLEDLTQLKKLVASEKEKVGDGVEANTKVQESNLGK